jgi:hypothetical protein
MRALARANGFSYIHFIQPNQYHSKRRFQGVEAAMISLPEEHPYVSGVHAGYPLFAQHAEVLEARGIISASGLFDRFDQQAYADNCCHYTEAGEAELANFVAAHVARAIGQDVRQTMGPRTIP